MQEEKKKKQVIEKLRKQAKEKKIKQRTMVGWFTRWGSPFSHTHTIIPRLQSCLRLSYSLMTVFSFRILSVGSAWTEAGAAMKGLCYKQCLCQPFPWGSRPWPLGQLGSSATVTSSLIQYVLWPLGTSGWKRFLKPVLVCSERLGGPVAVELFQRPATTCFDGGRFHCCNQ